MFFILSLHYTTDPYPNNAVTFIVAGVTNADGIWLIYYFKTQWNILEQKILKHSSTQEAVSKERRNTESFFVADPFCHLHNL